MTEYISKKVKSITFGLLGPQEIKKMACVKIVTPELYDKEGYPVDGGLMDVRLGVIDPGLRCKTCGQKLKECTGHFGYIELARPVVHINYKDVILDILRCTCRDCGRVKLTQEDIEKYENKFRKIEEIQGLEAKRRNVRKLINTLKNSKKCPHCESKQYTVKLEKPLTYVESDKKLSPIEVKTRLEKVPDDDLYILGINYKYARPEWMILDVMLIPPVTMRPSITLESGERSEDDLTHKLGDIVRINQRLFENINAGAPEIIVEDLWDLLQYHVTTFFDNTVSQVPPARHRNGQPLKTLIERIKSKEGRFRHNLAGKRVNFAARTAISPDPQIEFNEVGVPLQVAMEITVPERVTTWNKEYLKELIKNGPTVYPGANYVIRPDGRKKKITEETQEQLLEELDMGFQVERHLIDGDVSLFNRQPSLHRMSIMCHKIKVLPGKSFRLNPAVCPPYNADFDGDEMNLHVPQTEEARAEAEVLLQVQTQLISPKHGANIIGCLEDAVTGTYLLTKKGTEMSKEEAVELLLSIGVEDPRMKKFKKIVTGKEIFSTLIPEEFYFLGKAKNCEKCSKCEKTKCPNDCYVLIDKGQLVCGIVDKNLIGEGNGLLIRELNRVYREDKTIYILGKIFKLGIAYLLKRGFTAGVSNSDLSDDVKKKIKAMVSDTYRKVQSRIEEYDGKKLEAFPGKTLEETLELHILQLLNEVRNKIAKIIEEEMSDERNPFVVMAKSGGKGNLLQLSMVSSCVGQQALRGQRIEQGYKDRALSVFKEKDLGPEAKGFIKSGYKKGLSPTEFFFGAMTGRDSLMDTALRTPKSGYLYRRLANAMQDLRVEYDGTIRDANKTVIQFKYGDDGMDVSKSDKGTIDIQKLIRDIIGE